MRSHKDIRTSENAGFHCTDSHTACISIINWNLWLEPKCIKLLHDGKNPSKEWDTQIFCTFAMSFRVFVCLFCDTKISEISDMAKSWETFVAQLLIKTIKVYCCGNKVHNSIIIEGNTSVRLWRCGLKGIALVSIGSSIPNAISPSYAILAGVQQ